MGSIVYVLKDTLDLRVLLTSMTVTQPLVLTVVALMAYTPIPAYAIPDGQVPTAQLMLMSVIQILVFMEEIAL